jgi:hypothetical protein
MSFKLLILMYLEDDEVCVARLITDAGVGTYSRLSIEGMGPGIATGWYGEVAPYQSRMIMAMASESDALRVMAAVAQCKGVEDPRHPIRAFQLPIEAAASCECELPESGS